MVAEGDSEIFPAQDQKFMNFEILLSALQSVAREEIIKRFRSESCIASKRIIINVLESFGFRAQPLPVRVVAYNRHFNISLKRLRSLPFTDPLARARVKNVGPDAKSVCIGYGSDNPGDTGWDGHLIAWLPNKKWMIDASIAQVSRPERELELPGVLALQADAKFAKGLTPLCTSYKGALIRYDADPAERGYTVSSNWRVEGDRDGAAVNEVVENIINRVSINTSPDGA